jgi:hypothetical protein
MLRLTENHHLCAMVWREDRKGYDQFCAKHKAMLPLFFQAGWLDQVVIQGHWRAWVAFESDQAVAVFVGHYRRKYGLSALLMPQLTPYFGLWFPPMEGLDQKELTHALLSTLPRVFLTSLCLTPDFEDLAAWKLNGFHHKKRTTYLIQCKTIEAYEVNRSNKLQNHLKHAQAKLEIDISSQVEELVQLVRASFEKQNRELPYPARLVQQIFECTAANAKITLARDGEGVAHAGLLTVEDGTTVYNLISGRKRDAIRGAQALLLDDAIKVAIKKSKKFDFEGSSIPDIANFFSSFGGEVHHFYHVYRSAYRWTDALLHLIGKY